MTPVQFASRGVRGFSALLVAAALHAQGASALADDAFASTPVPPTVGQLYLFTPAFYGSSTQSGALVRYDPSTGQGTAVVDLFSTPSMPQSAAYDPVRGGVIFRGSPVNEAPRLWLVDGAGTLTDLGLTGESSRLTPAPDGKIYMRRAGQPHANSGGVAYLDGDGQVYPLLDAAGEPFTFGMPYRNLIYHAPTRSLVASASGRDCADVVIGQKSVVKRATLSADGKRVVGPVLCTEFTVSFSGGGAPLAGGASVGFSRLPGGDLLLVLDTNTNSEEARMKRVRPETMAVTTFAWNGPYLGAAAVSGGTWSSVLGKAVLLDTLSDDFRSFAVSETGPGTLLGASPKPSSSGGSGEVATLFEIDAPPCPGAWISYGNGLAGTGGFEPILNGMGCVVPGAEVSLHVASARGGTQAALFLGFFPSALPFKGGVLYVDPLLTLPFMTSGAPGEAGAGGLALPFPLAADPLLSGFSLYMQAAFADPEAPMSVSLTAGLRMLIG